MGWTGSEEFAQSVHCTTSKKRPLLIRLANMDIFKGKDAYDRAWDFLKKQVGDKSGPKTGCNSKLHIILKHINPLIEISCEFMQPS